MMNRIHIFTFLLLIFCHNAVTAQRWYVSATATGSGTGTTWQDAFTDLQDALLVVQVGEEIWIGNGVYYPGQNDSSTFEIPGGVSIYGGFVGFESLLSDRNLQNAATVLSGDIGVVGDSSDNVWHIVSISASTLPIVMDGIHFTGGSAWTGVTHAGGYRGAAIWIQQANLELSHCQFTQNYGRLGGAIYQSGGRLEIRECLFDGNRAETDFGGAIASAGSASLEIWDSRFQNNYARAGGAITFNASGTFSLYRTLLHSNESKQSGSVIYISGSTDSIRISNCVMLANQSGFGSVIYQNMGIASASPVEIIHCTIANNHNKGFQTSESAIHVITGNIELKNSILWQNAATSEINDFILVYADHCNISQWPASGNQVTYLAPMFRKPIDTTAFKIDADTVDYSLKFNSALRNTGNSNLTGGEDSTDIDGVKRAFMYPPAPGAYALNPCIQNSNLTYTGSNERCSGDILTLSAPIATHYIWNTGDTVRHIQIQNTGKYSVLLYYSAPACYSIAEDTFTYHTPQVSISGPFVICNPPVSMPVTLRISGNWSSILWSTQGTIDSIQTYIPGNYSVLVTDIYGCQASDSRVLTTENGMHANISVYDTSGVYHNDNVVCPETTLKITLSGAHAYKINQGAISTQTTPHYFFTTPTNYVVTGYSPLGCPGLQDSVFVDMHPNQKPNWIFTEHSEYNSNDFRVCIGDSFQVWLEPGLDYYWFDGSTDTFRNFIIPNINNPINNYRVHGVDNNTCNYIIDFPIVAIQPAVPILPIRYENDQLETDNYSRFQWYLNSAEIPGYTTRTIAPLGTGFYKVHAREPNGCMVSSALYYYLAASGVGLSEYELLMPPYPNPATQKLYIPGIKAGEVIKIWDIQGKIYIKIAGDDLALNIQELISGKYTFQFNESYYSFIKHTD